MAIKTNAPSVFTNQSPGHTALIVGLGLVHLEPLQKIRV